MPKSPIPRDGAKRVPPGIDLDAKTITFDFIKANGFRVVYIDGAHGGVNPKGLIQVAIYSERWPIPQQVQHEIDLVNGKAGEELVRIGRNAVVREVEAELLMKPETAEEIGRWLVAKAQEARSRGKQNGEEK